MLRKTIMQIINYLWMGTSTMNHSYFVYFKIKTELWNNLAIMTNFSGKTKYKLLSFPFYPYQNSKLRKIYIIVQLKSSSSATVSKGWLILMGNFLILLFWTGKIYYPWNGGICKTYVLCILKCCKDARRIDPFQLRMASIYRLIDFILNGKCNFSGIKLHEIKLI